MTAVTMCQETPALALNAWMNSTGHRTNLLTASHTYFGGGAESRDGTKYWVQIFASGGSVSSVASSTGSLTFASVEEMEAAYLICTNTDGYTSYLPLDTEYMTQSGSSYSLTLRGKTVTLTVGSAPAKTAFVDVPAGAYYADAVDWAVESGVTTGTSATAFSPDTTCISGQVITFLYRSNHPGAVNEPSNPYYAKAVAWAEERDLLSGTATAFAPDNNAPRSDIVFYLYRNSR